MADCERNLVALAFFYITLKAILCVQHFCRIDAMIFIVNLLKKGFHCYLCSLYS